MEKLFVFISVLVCLNTPFIAIFLYSIENYLLRTSSVFKKYLSSSYWFYCSSLQSQIWTFEPLNIADFSYFVIHLLILLILSFAVQLSLLSSENCQYLPLWFLTLVVKLRKAFSTPRLYKYFPVSFFSILLIYLIFKFTFVSSIGRSLTFFCPNG